MKRDLMIQSLVNDKQFEQLQHDLPLEIKQLPGQKYKKKQGGQQTSVFLILKGKQFDIVSSTDKSQTLPGATE